MLIVAEASWVKHIVFFLTNSYCSVLIKTHKKVLICSSEVASSESANSLVLSRRVLVET